MDSEFRRRFSWLFILAWVVSAPAAANGDDAKPAKIEKEESWHVILLGGQRVGYSRSVIEPFERDGERLVRGVDESHMAIKRFGQILRIGMSVITEETETGDLKKFIFEMSNSPNGVQKTIGTVNGDKLMIETEIAGRKTTTTKSWDPKLKSPIYQERLLRDHPLKPGESRSFDAYVPAAEKVSTTKIIADEEETIALLDGTKVKALKVRVTQSIIPGVELSDWVDAQGETLKSATKLIGSDMVTYKVSREEALKEIDTQDLDFAVATLIKVKPIPDIRERKEITYRIHIPDHNPADYLANDDVQTVKKIDEHTSELAVRALPIPAKSTPGKSPGQEYLKASAYLQSDDPAVRKHADAAAGTEKEPGKIARAMEKYVYEKLVKKNFSTALASAAEVAQNLEGDCTEHAVLLAAMLRAKQIPSRLAIGVVYVEVEDQPSFGGHMWTEAWLNGKWTPLDAALGHGDVGHIKFTASSLSDDVTPIGAFAPLMLAIGHMQIEVVNSK